MKAKAYEHNKNAVYGTNIESLFKNSISTNERAQAAIKEHFKIDKNSKLVKTYKTGKDSGKADALLRFSCGKTLGANIKAFSTKIGFNQLTRLSLDNFADRFNIDDSIKRVFGRSILEVASEPSSKFIADTNILMIKEAISVEAKEIAHSSLAGTENPELLVIFNGNINRFYIYCMKTFLKNLNYDIDFSKKGIIKLGNYITIQRKGGNGKRAEGISKTSMKHPGNQLQIKMRIDKVVEAEKELVSYGF